MSKFPKLKIGIDIDNVISDSYTSYIERFNKEFNINIQYEEVFDFFYFENHTGVGKERAEVFIEKLLRDSSFQLSLRPYEDAINVIKKWMNLGYSTHYITARPLFAKETTLTWLNKHGFTGCGTTLDLFDENKKYQSDIEYKLKTAEKLGINIFIEDAKEIAQSLKMPVYLLDRPWNKGELPKNVKRVFSWKEVDEAVSEFKIKKR